MGGGDGGGDAERSGPPVPAETRQPRGERPEHSCIPTQLPASVSPPDPRCGGHPCIQHPTAPVRGCRILSSLPLPSQARSQLHPRSAGQMPTSHLDPRSVGQSQGGGPGGVEPCPTAAEHLPGDGGSWGSAGFSRRGVPCRAERRRGRQPVPPSPGPTCRKLVRGLSTAGWQWGIVAPSYAPGVRAMPGPPPRATCLASQHPWVDGGRARWYGIPGSTQSNSHGPRTTSAISSGSASQPRAAPSPPGTHLVQQPSCRLLPAGVCASPDAGVQVMLGMRVMPGVWVMPGCR